MRKFTLYTSAELINCIFWGNTASEGHEISIREFAPNPTLRVYHCDIEGGLDDVRCPDAGTLVVWPAGSPDIDPCCADPGYWDPNGTENDPNDDFWVDGDYHLLSQAGRWDPDGQTWVQDSVTSRCIDAGNPGTPLGDEPYDHANLRINMGAYGGTAKASKSPHNWSLLADLTNDGIVNLDDLAGQVTGWQESVVELPGDLNRDGTIDIADLVLTAQDWLELTSWH